MSSLAINHDANLNIMANAIEALRIQLRQPASAETRQEQVYEFLLLAYCEAQAIISEAGGDSHYLDVENMRQEVECAFADRIEREREMEPSYDYAVMNGTMNPVQQFGRRM